MDGITPLSFAMTGIHPDQRTPPGPRARFPGHMLVEFARRRLPFMVESAEGGLSMRIEGVNQHSNQTASIKPDSEYLW